MAAILATTLLSGCGSSGSSASGSSGGASDGSSANASTALDPAAAKLLPAKYKSSGVVSVASAFGYPPEQFYEADGKTPTGFSVELGQALGKELGVNFAFQNVSFDSILPGIQAGRYDIAISSMSITPQRSAQVNFVKYLNSGGSLLVKGSNPKHIEGIADLCGKTDANTTGSLHGQFLEQYSKTNCVAKGKPPITILNFSDAASPDQAVQTGRADVCYRDFTANQYTAANSNGQFKVVGGITETSPYGIAVGKDNLALANAINAALNALIKDGTYQSIMKKWGVSQADVTSSSVVKAS